MGIAGMRWQFEHGPPTLAQFAGRLSAGCGLPITIHADNTTSGELTVGTLGSQINVTTAEDGALSLLFELDESPFLWTHLEAALAELGGQRDSSENLGEADPPPAWATRPWSEISAWRRFTLRHRSLYLRAQMLLVVPLLPFIIVRDEIRHRRAVAQRQR